jgi:hypothetical protein
MVRHSMRILMPDPKNPKSQSRVEVTEQRKTVRLHVFDGNSGLDRAVDLTLPEARKLSEHLNLICRRIATRPAFRP